MCCLGAEYWPPAPLVFHVYLQLLVIHTDGVLWGSAPPQNIGMLYTARHGTRHGDHTDLEQEYTTVTRDIYCAILALVLYIGITNLAASFHWEKKRLLGSFILQFRGLCSVG